MAINIVSLLKWWQVYWAVGKMRVLKKMSVDEAN
jgi:hypothetical protein